MSWVNDLAVHRCPHPTPPAHLTSSIGQGFLKALGVCILKMILNMKYSNSNTLGERQNLVNDLHNSSSEEVVTMK